MSIPDPDQSSILTKILTTILILPKLIILAVFWIFTVGGGCLAQIGAMVIGGMVVWGIISWVFGC